MKKAFVVVKHDEGADVYSVFQNKENALKNAKKSENSEIVECDVEDTEDKKEITEKELNEDHEIWASCKFRRKRK